MAKRVRTVLKDPRYKDFVKRYRFDWKRLAVELVGKEPSWQQRKIIDSAQRIGSRTTVSSGHGTGKSDMTSIMIIAYMLTFPNARVVLVANNARQVQIGVWKYLKSNWNAILQKHGWLQQYFTITETAFYENSQKGIWQTNAKSCRIGNEEALAGEHAAHLFVIVDEASGVSDKAFGVLGGALTETDNRMLLLSQPTRPAGFFYDTHHELSEPRGKWRSIRLNSEESPFVTVDFILEKRLQYGGRESPEYLIKVRGEFPATIAGMLLGRADLDRSAKLNLHMPDGWGWVALVDVGNGRDRSVLNICKVWGQRMERIVKCVKLVEQPSNVDPVYFADIIHAELREELYPNITIAVDSDGVGYDTATCLERHGHRVQRIRWGKTMHSTSDKQRFKNQRAYANVMARDAIKQGRMQIDRNVKTAEQGCKIPCAINESGQWVMMPKPMMKEKFNISSPDRWDTFCFSMLVDYVPFEMEMTEDMQEKHSAMEDWVSEAMGDDFD